MELKPTSEFHGTVNPKAQKVKTCIRVLFTTTPAPNISHVEPRERLRSRGPNEHEAILSHSRIQEHFAYVAAPTTPCHALLLLTRDGDTIFELGSCGRDGEFDWLHGEARASKRHELG